MKGRTESFWLEHRGNINNLREELEQMKEGDKLIQQIEWRRINKLAWLLSRPFTDYVRVSKN